MTAGPPGRRRRREHLGRLAVQQLRGAGHGRAVRGRDRLVPQAHAEDRDVAGALADDGHADAGVLRGARAGAEQDAVELAGLVRGHLVVAAHDDVGSQLGQVLDQVEDERVVVVDDEDARHGAHCDGCAYAIVTGPVYAGTVVSGARVTS